MKRLTVFFSMSILLFASLVLQAQEPADYFVGDWKILVEGTPSGDAEMIMHLERVDGKLKGEMRGEEGNDPIKIERIEEKESTLNVYYFASGYDISMRFEKVDANNLKGSLLGMFTANGKRVVE
jgi:cytochrome c